MFSNRLADNDKTQCLMLNSFNASTTFNAKNAPFTMTVLITTKSKRGVLSVVHSTFYSSDINRIKLYCLPLKKAYRQHLRLLYRVGNDRFYSHSTVD